MLSLISQRFKITEKVHIKSGIVKTAIQISFHLVQVSINSHDDIQTIKLVSRYYIVSKNAPDIFSCNLSKHLPIWIIFGTKII